MKMTDFFCDACGWVGNPVEYKKKKALTSSYRKATNCPECQCPTLTPIATRSRLAKPDLMFQPPDAVISKILKKFASQSQSTS